MLISITIEHLSIYIRPSRLIFPSTFNYPLLSSDGLALQDTSFCFCDLGTRPGSDSLHLWSDASRLLECPLNVTTRQAWPQVVLCGHIPKSDLKTLKTETKKSLFCMTSNANREKHSYACYTLTARR